MPAVETSKEKHIFDILMLLKHSSQRYKYKHDTGLYHFSTFAFVMKETNQVDKDSVSIWSVSYSLEKNSGLTVS